ncbi:MAG: hypothetical protein R3D68_10730 [Hyphomicrobiaceae bacterium]
MLLLMLQTDWVLLELAANRPLENLSEFHLRIAKRLEARGFLRFWCGKWFATRAGLTAIARTVH